MSVEILLAGGLRMTMTGTAAGGGRDQVRPPAYPTACLQRGLLLADGERDLAEEGVGFAVPVLKLGACTVFPGGAAVSIREAGGVWEVEALFRLDLVERLVTVGGRPVGPRALYAAKDGLAALHRRLPASRGLLTATSSLLRSRLRLVTVYVPVAPLATVPVLARVDAGAGRLDVSARLDGLPAAVTEVVLMNEQGARAFDRFEEPGRPSLEGEAIGAWDLVAGPGARFAGRAHDVVFALEAADGAPVHRGRELVGGRLAWAGFGVAARPPRPSLAYSLTVGRRGA